MKQNITKQQLDELSPKAKEKLHKYLGINISSSLDWPEKYYQTALLNIGEMIEFLDEQNKRNACIVKSFITDEWVLNHPKRIEVKYICKELCDALWEAVKGVLEEK